MNATPAMAHLSDADLVRHIDGEGGPDEHARRDAHLRVCPACAARADRLAGQSRDLTAWLVRADHEPRPTALPERRRRPDLTPWLRAAAIVLLLAAPLAAVPPVREWVVERIGLAPDPEPQVAATEADRAAPVVRFTPAPGTFTVRADAPADGATLALGRADGADAVLEGAAGEDDPPVVSETELRLMTAPGRGYVLRLPDAVTAVVVHADGRTVRVAGADLEAGSVVPLSVNR